jgi:hypothetical protein
MGRIFLAGEGAESDADRRNYRVIWNLVAEDGFEPPTHGL